MNNKQYISFAFKPFTAIRLFVYGFCILLVVFSVKTHSFSVGLMYSLLVNVIAVLTYVLTSYTEVSRQDDNISVLKLYDSLRVQKVSKVETWWSYDFGIESPAINEGSQGNSAPISNKINCFLKLSSEHDHVILYEQIYLGSKFPNNHGYLPSQIVDKSKLHRVWDIDSCIESLALEPFVKLKL